MSTYRSGRDKFLRKFQRSPFFFRPSKSENSDASLYSKNRPKLQLKEKKRARRNPVRSARAPAKLRHRPREEEEEKKSVEIRSARGKEKGKKRGMLEWEEE